MERIVGKRYRSYWMGIAIFFVLMDHIVNPRGTNDFAYKLIKMVFMQGGWGVNVFFFLSAYGLCYSLNNNSLLGYYYHRVKRIFPIYLIYLLFVSVLRVLLMGKDFSLSYFVVRLFGLNIFNDNIMLTGDAWYMSAIIVLYILFPMIYPLIKSIVKYKWSVFFLLIVIITLLFYIPGVRSHINGLFVARFQVILLGMATYFFNNASSKRTKDLIALFSLTSCLSLLTYSDCEFFFFIPLILWAFDKIEISFPFFSFFSFLGKHSLEIYLSQTLILQWYFLEMNGNYYYDSLICCIFVVLFASILWLSQISFWHLCNKILHQD